MNLLKKLMLVILSIILFFSTVSLLLLFPISNSFKKDNIEKIIKNFEIEKLSIQEVELMKNIDSILEPIYEDNDNKISPEEIFEILNTKEFNSLTTNITSNMMEYILTGKDTPLISEDKLKGIISHIINTIDKKGQLTEKEKASILQKIHEKSKEYIKQIPKTSILEDYLTQKEKRILRAVQFILGEKLRICLVITAIICIIGITIFKTKKIEVIKTGLNIILTAGISTLIITLIFKELGKLIFEGEIYILDIINLLTKNILSLSIGTTVFTIVILIIYKIIATKIPAKKANIITHL